jgi:Carbohydrate binding domain
MCIRSTQAARFLTKPPEERTAGLARSMAVLLAFCCTAVGQEFTPFAIPARIDSGHAIWVSSSEPIAIDSERLRADEHFYRDQRVRIWGVNLSFAANFPTHEDAPHVATRLAAAGVNSVRCHHMDTSRWPRGIWSAKDGRTIEPKALDRLDFFINELAQRGIWVNINLHVGRAHSEYLGLPETNTSYDKIAGIFTPALVEAQKQFARDLLDHVNPYRKVRYADDPAIAFVEITNEDSFFMWNGDEKLRALPAHYEQILRSLYNQWLARRYSSDDRLRSAWSGGTEPLGQNLLRNGDFGTGATGAPQHWNLEQHEGCRASIARRPSLPDDAIEIQIEKADETEWHLQLTQGGLALTQGRYYTISFDASSSRPRTVSCSVGQAHSPWGNLGLSRRLELTDQLTHYTVGFVATASDSNARISFVLGGDDAPINLAQVKLRPGGQVGLAEGESLDDGNVALFQENESEPRILDRLVFLAETEKAYFDEMRRFIKADLGCDALITGTIVFGPLGLYAQSDMDFIDSHAYWQHPRFPGRPWDQGNWIVEQKPMTDHRDEATLFRIAAERLTGKPFTVSEYNHPAPMDAQAECVPIMASFAAAQDWDGVWFYTYSHSGDSWDRQTLSSFFDIDTNPAKWGFMRAGTAIFRDGAVVPLQRARSVRIAGSRNTLAHLAELHAQRDRDMLSILMEAGGITRNDMLEGLYVPSYGQDGGSPPESKPSATTLTWSAKPERGTDTGLYSAVSSDAQVFTGHAALFEKATSGNLRILSPKFVTLTVTPVDDNRKILLTACGRCENTAMQFSADRRTVGRNWGQAPVQIETVAGQLVLPEGQWTCHALAPDGSTRRRVPTDGNVLKLLPEYETMWYLLQRQAK